MKLFQLGVAFVVGAGIVALLYVPHEAYDSLYSECRACGLSDPEIEDLLGIVRDSSLSRAESLDLFRGTFGPDDDRQELCEGCAAAVLDAAGR